MKVVVDASVAVKWFVSDALIEQNTDEAVILFREIASNGIQIIQPVHWLAEVISVLTRVCPDIVDKSIPLLDALEFEIADSVEIYQRAAQLSIQVNHHLFDTLYHAVALAEKATLITADQKYFDKASQDSNILLLAHFPGWVEKHKSGN